MRFIPFRKTTRKQERVNEVFDYLDKKYNKKVVINENIIKNDKIRKSHKELFRDIYERGHSFIENNNYHTIVWRDNVGIFSKNYFVESKRDGKILYIEKIERKGPKTISDLHQIKTSINYLKKHCKKNNIKKIVINTWMFESFPGFAEHLGFKPTSKGAVILYRTDLLSLGIEKVTHLNFKKGVIDYLVKNKKTGLLEPKKMSTTDLVDSFPEYVCEIK